MVRGLSKYHCVGLATKIALRFTVSRNHANNRWVRLLTPDFHNLRCEFAMESLLKNLKEHVTCSICLDIFTESKTIRCLHTFCCECLKRHALTTQQHGKFRCPECQAQVDVPASFDKLPTGFLQNSLLGVLAVQQSGDGSEINCGNCRKKSAETSFCFECGKFMCADCVNAHELLRNVAFEGHKVRPIKHFQVEDYEALLKRQSFCSQQYHEREVTRFFCIDCQTCVCQVCVVTDHKNHAVDPLDKAADAEKDKVMAAAELIKVKSKICSDMIGEFEQTAVDLETNSIAAKQKVFQTAERMITKIREREREAITAIENTRVSRNEILNASKVQAQSLIKQMNQAVDFASNLVQRSSSSDIMQRKVNLEKRFEDLNKITAPALPVGSFVKFVSTPKVPGTYNIKVTINGDNLHHSPFVVQVKERRLEIVGELDLKGEILKSPHKIAVNSKGLIAVTDWDGHCILAFDKEGKYPRKFGSKGKRAGQLNHPTGVTYLNDDHILVADVGNNRIQQFNVHTGNFVKAFGKYGTGEGELSDPEDVCMDCEGRVVIADWGNNRIQFFTEDGEPVFTFGDSGSEKLVRPTGCIFHQNMFIVCDRGNNCLKIFDRSGKFLRTIGEKGKGDGQLNWPQGLCVEKCGDHHNILVCDRDNKRIVQFSVEGSFSGQTFTGLQSPCGIATTPDGRILVTDIGAKKVYFLK